jgi:hypothetical protein
MTTYVSFLMHVKAKVQHNMATDKRRNIYTRKPIYVYLFRCQRSVLIDV